MRTVLTCAAVIVAACQGRGAGRPAASGVVATDTSVGATGQGTGFTSFRPLPSAESLAALGARPASPTAEGAIPYSINVSYDGAPARVVITTPDGQVISDTTRPRDTSCDNFAPDTSSDPNADGVGCLPESYGTLVRNSRPGVGYIQFTATDTGNIAFTVEPFTSGNYGVGYWGGPAFLVRPGQTHIFRMTLPGRREDGPVVVVPLTGPVDTFVPSR